MLRFLLILFLAFITPALAVGQSVSGIDGGGGLSVTDPPADAVADTDLTPLIELLRDDAARAVLIEELERRNATGDTTTAEPATPAASTDQAGDQASNQASSQAGSQASDQNAAASETDATGAEAAETEAVPLLTPDLPSSIGRQAAEVTVELVAGLLQEVERIWNQLQYLPTRLASFDDAIDRDVIIDTLRDLAFVIVGTYAVFILLRLAVRPLIARLAARAHKATFLVHFILSLVAVLIDGLTVAAAWAAGYGISAAYVGEGYLVNLRQSLYLNAFLVAELVKVAARAVLAPRFAELRQVRLPDEAVRILWRWLRFTATVVIYVELLLVPIVRTQVGYFASVALSTVASALVVLITIALAFRRRHDLVEWLMPTREGEERDAADKALRWLLGLMHWPIILYLMFLLVVVLTRPGGVMIPLLWSTLQVVGTLLAGMVATSALSRAARRGVGLPGFVNERLPMFEQRLNMVVPHVLTLIRLAIYIAVVMACLDIMGLFDTWRWITGAAGLAFAASAGSTLLIVVVVFAAWLAFTAWIDYRLNPYFGTAPTPRETTLLTLLRNAVTIILAILTLMVLMSQLGLDIAPLLASAGVLGLAIGFGAQKLVQDIITGIFIQFENAINVGDVISVGGITGTVEKLTVRSVSLRDVEGIFHIIPFSSVDLVSNYTRNFAYYVCDMGIAYREDIEVARQAMHDAFDELITDEEHRHSVLGDLEWFGLQSFGDSAIVLRVRIKTMPGMQWGVGRAYNLILKRRFDALEIEIPFPHQTIYFGVDRAGAAPPLHVRTAPETPASQDLGPAAPAPSDAGDADTGEKPGRAKMTPGDVNDVSDADR